MIEVSQETRYYIASLTDTALALAERIRAECSRGKQPDRETSLAIGGLRTKCITSAPVNQGEDASRIRTIPLVQIWALARNLALNLYRSNGFEIMAQAERRSVFSLNTLKHLFRMK
jgi:hypothetical protein